MKTQPVDTLAKRRSSITDARGQIVAPLDPLAMYVLRQHHAIEESPLRAIAQDNDLRITKSERAFLMVGILAFVAVACLFVYSMFFSNLSNAFYAKSSSLMYFSFMPWFIWFMIRRARYRKIAPVLLRHSRCPHCGYDLSNLPVDEDDGCTVCPECGCAWELPTSKA